MILNSNVMGHLQPTGACSQAEIECWYNSNPNLHFFEVLTSLRNVRTTRNACSRVDNIYQCKDIDDIHNCTLTNATDEYDTLLCKIKILHRILDNSIDG